MAKRFDEQVVWITGASSGIGAAMAREFSSRGATLCLSARRAERLESLVAELAETGCKSVALPCDVTVDEQLEATLQRIVELHGKIDVAVANAGFAVGGRVENLSSADWRRQFDVNVVAAAMTAKVALPELRKSKGRVALVGSVMAMVPMARNGAYTASKYALRALGQTLSLELHGTGVSCTTMHPGFVESEIAMVDNQGVFQPDKEDKRPAKFMWPADKAARVMVDAIAKRKREFVFTSAGKFGGYMGRHFPGLVHFAQTRGK